jgi:hypothetical protein
MRGNIPAMTIPFNTLTAPMGQTASISATVTVPGRQMSLNERHGNSVGGPFVLRMCVPNSNTAVVACANTGTLNAQWDATAMNTALTTTIASIVAGTTVLVTRSGPTSNAANTWEWSVTFLDPNTGGDVPMMTVVSSTLTGAAPMVSVREQVKGNELSGTWQILFLGEYSPLFRFDSTADEVKAGLQEMAVIDHVRGLG